MPLGNVYYYFRTKQAIAEGVADIFVRETQAMLEEISAGEADPRRRVISLLRKMGVNRGNKSRIGGVIFVMPITLQMARSAPKMEPKTSGYSSPRYS